MTDGATPVWPFPFDDPYPEYARARAEAAVAWDADLAAWRVLSHAGALAVLRSDAWSADPRRSPQVMARLAPGVESSDLLSKMLIFSDPPEHARLREAVNRFFTPRRVEGIRHRVASIVKAAFDGFGGEVDLLDEIAYPVPLAVICELFDVGTDTALLLRDETPAMAAMLDLLAPPELQAQAATAAMTAMMALVPIVADRRRAPGDDLLSLLAERLEPEEALITALLLLAAGHETTSALIGNAVVALAGQAESVRRGGVDVGDFIEEVLRWESPVQVTGRVAARDLDLFGCHVRETEQVVVILGAANRDPAVFPEPDSFDPARPRAGHLAFGHGAHFCVGAALARLEAAEVIRYLVGLDWELAGYERAASSTFRRMKSLTLRL
jgi:cytochrome P450